MVMQRRRQEDKAQVMGSSSQENEAKEKQCGRQKEEPVVMQ